MQIQTADPFRVGFVFVDLYDSLRYMDTLLKKIEDLRQRFLKTRELMDIDGKEVKEKELRLKMAEAGFWDDQTEAVKISREAEGLADEVNKWNQLSDNIRDLEEIAALAERENNDDLSLSGLASDLETRFLQLEKDFGQLEFQSFFSGKYDRDNAIISIHAGTGGVDAQDWAQMLERMYFRFAERQGFKAEILDRNYGNEAGIKSVDFRVVGPYAYGYLKSENGVHRLLRNSPFNADGLRQTSFALVEVIPELEDDDEVVIKEDDIRIDVFRSSGPGGQSVNTTDSAVRIVHLPTNITVSCQTERSQHQNKENAMKILRAKLSQRVIEDREAEEKQLKGDNKAEWGKQIRSYFMYGNKLVKDHRSEYETSSVEAVLDGDLSQFMEAYLRFLKR